MAAGGPAGPSGAPPTVGGVEVVFSWAEPIGTVFGSDSILLTMPMFNLFDCSSLRPELTRVVAADGTDDEGQDDPS